MTAIARFGRRSLPAMVVAASLLVPEALTVAANPPASQTGPAVTHGVVVGEVRARSAVLWARANRPATLHVDLSGGGHAPIVPVRVRRADDHTGQVVLRGLRPSTEYRYRVWFTGNSQARGPVVGGSFATAPRRGAPASVRLAFGGDVAGQNVCRDAAEGFPIMDTVRSWRPDVFVGLGDMIYADDLCLETGRYGNAQVPGNFAQAADLEGFWVHWRYNRADAGLRSLLASASYVGVWDDHEVVNDFGPLSDTRDVPPYTPGEHLLPIGLDAFLDYTPIATSPQTPERLYRTLRWGKHLQLFVLDTRQYRDANIADDSPERPKTMLGREQLTWLKETLVRSNATWKVIVSSVPMSIPTGFPPTNGRDGWANFDQETGFEQELLDILRFVRDERIDGTVWLSTDVHFAEVFRYTPFADDPDFVVHEIVTGPMNAGIFPNQDFDTTLNPERLFFFGPSTPADVTSWEVAKEWLNFGTLQVDRDGTLTAQVIDTAGDVEFSLELAPS
jgi:alkaline phosphatase D